MNKLIKFCFNSTYFKLIIILLFALFLRLFRLSESPPRLTHDEMSIGYNAFSIIKTGKDEWGKILPLDFEAFGDHKLPGYIYALAPFLAFFQLSSFVVKIPSILAGVAVVIGIFLIIKNLTKNDSLSLFGALLMAISPWSIQISRMALETHLALLFFIFGLYYLLTMFDFKKNNTKNFIFNNYRVILSAILLGLTSYFYVAYRLITFLLIIILFILSLKYELNRKKILIFCLFFLIIVSPIMQQIFGKSGSARFNQISMFSDEGINSTILEQHNFCFLSQPKFLPKVCRLIYNKPFLYVETFTKNYLTFIFPSFLFINGDKLEYLNNPGFGEFYLFLAPFYLIGVYEWFKKTGYKANLIKICFLISPIPSALAGYPQIVRGSALLPFIILFISFGIFEVFSLIKNRYFKIMFYLLIIFLLLISFIRFYVSYTYIYPGKYETAFYPLSDKLVAFLDNQESNYDMIYFDKNSFPDAHILISFYQKIDPLWYQENILRPINKDGFGFSHPTKLGKYEFGENIVDNFICMTDDKRKILYITNNSQIIPQWNLKDFSNVHIQTKIYDIDKTRDELRSSNKFLSICHD